MKDLKERTQLIDRRLIGKTMKPENKGNSNFDSNKSSHRCINMIFKNKDKNLEKISSINMTEEYQLNELLNVYVTCLLMSLLFIAATLF